MENLLDQNDTFNVLKYKRFGVHPSYPLNEPYTYWVNDEGQFHREDGPAMIAPNGNKYWFLHGKCHREDGPAIERSDGTKEWWIDGNLHREDGPAIEYSNGSKAWWVNGKCYRSE